MLSYRVLLIVGALALLPAHVASKQEPPRKEAAPTNATSLSPPKVYTEADYWKPLDAWLKSKGSTLNGHELWLGARDAGLDPDFVIAVAYAESSLGKVKQRGAKHNPFSLCSYDSTNTTCDFKSDREAVQYLGKTLNNQMLGKYWRVSELSRSHNPHQSPVYATSNGNWFRNVVGTMNALKGKNEVDYEFRRK